MADGEWYWVTDGDSVWPAMRSKHAAGGWSNEDTWEDFNGEVIACERIKPPRILRVAE